MLQSELSQNKHEMLQYLLYQNKYYQLAKIMLSQKVSRNVLIEYHHQDIQPTQPFSDNIIMKSLDSFTIEQLIQMKGSTKQKPKYYQNTLLLQMARKKLSKTIINPQCRLKLWLEFTDIYTQQNLYQQLFLFDIPNEFNQQIIKDMNRTLTTHQIKNDAVDVLTQFSKYNPFIGYCQGMNFIVTFILERDFTKQETFYIMKRITEWVLPTNYYTTLDPIFSDIRILYDLVAVVLPNFSKKLTQLMSISNESYNSMLLFANQWFVSLFTSGRLDVKIKCIIWDRLMVEGDIVLMKSALVLLQIIEQRIIKINSYDQYIKTVEQGVSQIHSQQQFIHRYNQLYINYQIFNLVRLNIIESHHQQQVISNNKLIYKKKCNKNWTACVQSIEQQNRLGTKNQLFIFRKGIKVQLIDNYLENISTQCPFGNSKYNNGSDAVMIGRMQHICNADEQLRTQDSLSEKSQKKKKGLLRTDARAIRKNIIQKLIYGGRNTLHHSQSMLFMKNMIENVSFTNLMEIYNQDINDVDK